MRTTLGIIVTVGLAFTAGVWALSSKAESTKQAQAQIQGKVQAQSQAGRVSLLEVEGMTCAGCAAAVKMAATNVDGVTDAKVSFEEGTAQVTYDPSKTTPEAIARAVSESSGYKTRVAQHPPS